APERIGSVRTSLRRSSIAEFHPRPRARASTVPPAASDQRPRTELTCRPVRTPGFGSSSAVITPSTQPVSAPTLGQGPPGPGTFRGSGTGDGTQLPITQIGPGDPGQPRRLLLCSSLFRSFLWPA